MALLLLAMPPAQADSVDVRATIDRLLAKLAPFSVTEHRTREVRYRDCSGVTMLEPASPFMQASYTVGGSGRLALGPGACTWETQDENYDVTVQHMLVSSNLYITDKKPVTWGEAVFGEIPDQVFTKSTEVTNCDPDAGQGPVAVSHVAMDLTLYTHKSLTLTAALANIRSEKIDFNIDRPTFGTIEEGLVFSHSFPTDANTGYTEDAAVTRSDAIDVQMTGHTTRLAQIQALRVHGRMPFTSAIVVEGDTNDGKKVSDHLSLADRTIPVTGDLVVDGGTKGSTVIFIVPFRADMCPAHAAGVTLKPNVSTSGMTLIRP
ncbi:MAG TPA: hypothetical protein VNU97_16030 [Rhizomicrobium sp.]|nr:hypothetical protein [Rhizomicrobium sp.]